MDALSSFLDLKAEEVLAAIADAEPGEYIVAHDIQESSGEALCWKLEDTRGLEFRARPGDTSADPVGDLLLCRDPGGEHDAATFNLFASLFESMRILGRRRFDCVGSKRCPLHQGWSKEAYFALEWRDRRGVPVIVAEVAVSQSTASLLAYGNAWLRPRPQGGGANIWLGIDIRKLPGGGGGGAPALHAYLGLKGGAIGPPLSFGRGMCVSEGNPEFFLWLPLRELMLGASWCLRAVLSAEIAALGLWRGFTDCAYCILRCRWLSAARMVWARTWAPWAALPVDLFLAKSDVYHEAGIDELEE